MTIRLSLLALLISVAIPLHAAQAPPENFNVYYTVRESAVSSVTGFEPWEALKWRAAVAAYDLLAMDYHPQPLPQAPERYNRDRHFGQWLRDASCLNTRARVLIRDSASPVRFSSSGCTVETGEWHEPYKGYVAYNASQIQIDHMVPLKNAYISGAGFWAPKHRCLYANFMGNGFHLLSVDGNANMNKGDQTPSTWMPMNAAHRCEYLRNWLRIKLIWGLALGEREARAIQALARQESCDPSTFRWPAAELAGQRQYIQQNENLCP